MSSDGFHYLASDGLALLEHVLAQANFPRSTDTSNGEVRSDAAHLFIARRPCGETGELRLRETLSELIFIDDYPHQAEDCDIAVSIAAADMTTSLRQSSADMTSVSKPISHGRSPRSSQVFR